MEGEKGKEEIGGVEVGNKGSIEKEQGEVDREKQGRKNRGMRGRQEMETD